MNSVHSSNPFAARKIRPGQLPFCFDNGSLEKITELLQRNRFRGQILGPHGSGKSTLLLNLISHLQAMTQTVTLIRLPARGDPQFRAVSQKLDQATRTTSDTIVAVDGWDQLGLLQRARISAQIHLRAKGLIVTTHRPAQLPILARTSVSPETAQRILAILLSRAGLSSDVRRQWKTHFERELPKLLTHYNGNFREVLFELYDRYAAPS